MKSRQYLWMVVIVLFLCTPVTEAEAGVKASNVAEVAERLKRALSAPSSASHLLEEGGAKEYRSLFDDTFHLSLDFGSARRLIISPGGRHPNLAVFVFEAPMSLQSQFGSFDHLWVHGTLSSKVHTCYTMLSENGVLCIVLSEQKAVPRDSPVISAVSQALAAEP